MRRSVRLTSVTVATIGLGAGALGAASPATADPAPTLPTAFVTNVLDGDTIQVVDAVRGAVNVRLLGVDAPNPGECWAPQATDFTRASLQNQLVAVISDPASAPFDQYGQTLAYVVRIDGWNQSVESARVGAARASVSGPLVKGGEITAVEAGARSGRLGLWGGCGAPTPPPPLAPAPAPAPVVQAPPPGPAPQNSGVYYANCDDARARGAAPVLRGQPGYRAGLDRDSDGIGCE